MIVCFDLLVGQLFVSLWNTQNTYNRNSKPASNPAIVGDVTVAVAAHKKENANCMELNGIRRNTQQRHFSQNIALGIQNCTHLTGDFCEYTEACVNVL